MILKIYWIVSVVLAIMGMGLQLGKFIVDAERSKISPLIAIVAVFTIYSLSVPLYYAAFRYIFHI